MATFEQTMISMALTENSSPSEYVYVNYRRRQEMARKLIVTFQVKHRLPFNPQMVHIFLQFNTHISVSYIPWMTMRNHQNTPNQYASHKIFVVTRFFGVQKITFHDVVLKRLHKRLHKQRIVPLILYNQLAMQLNNFSMLQFQQQAGPLQKFLFKTAQLLGDVTRHLTCYSNDLGHV